MDGWVGGPIDRWMEREGEKERERAEAFNTF